jgi:uncharacterized protein YbaP (TraB family)
MDRMLRRTLHRLAPLPLAGVLGCAAFGARPPVECSPGTAGTPLAYELRAPDGSRAFLQGSVHFAQDEQATLDPRALAELRDAQLLVSEIDMQQLTPEDIRNKMVLMGSLPPGERMQDQLSPEAWERFRARMEQAGADPEVFQPFEPWVAALSLMGLSLIEAGFTPEEGVELQVYEAERPTATRGLETVGDQLALFDSLDRETQEVMLLQTLESSAENAAELQSMFTAWRCGDGAALDAMLGEMVAENPQLAGFYEATVYERNSRMADGVEAVLAEVDRAFVVVGALHLVGARGIPALLEQAGYEVEQLRMEPAAPEPPR